MLCHSTVSVAVRYHHVHLQLEDLGSIVGCDIESGMVDGRHFPHDPMIFPMFHE